MTKYREWLWKKVAEVRWRWKSLEWRLYKDIQGTGNGGYGCWFWEENGVTRRLGKEGRHTFHYLSFSLVWNLYHIYIITFKVEIKTSISLSKSYSAKKSCFTHWYYMKYREVELGPCPQPYYSCGSIIHSHNFFKTQCQRMKLDSFQATYGKLIQNES